MMQLNRTWYLAGACATLLAAAFVRPASSVAAGAPANASAETAAETSLAARYRFDREAYTDSKSQFVQSMLDRARNRRPSR